MRNILKLCLALLLCFMIASCVNRKPTDPKVDPGEASNRVIFAFNQCFDNLFFKPVAIVYYLVTPPPLRQGITNVFANIGELTTMPNDILQGKFKFFFTDLWRFIINSTIGVAGLFDVATRMGLPKHYEDFGLTLAYWDGGKISPYSVSPIFGPSTQRQSFGRIFDWAASPWFYIRSGAVGSIANAIKYINIRANLLGVDKFIKEAFDPYIFVRNAYLQRRHLLIEENKLPYQTLAQRRALEGKPIGTPAPDVDTSVKDDLYNTAEHQRTEQTYKKK